MTNVTQTLIFTVEKATSAYLWTESVIVQMIVGIGRMRTAASTMSALIRMVAVMTSVSTLLAAHSVPAGQGSGWKGTTRAKVWMPRLGY